MQDIKCFYANYFDKSLQHEMHTILQYGNYNKLINVLIN